jgi:uncharacterized repeat protein (TIGR01451 family)
VLLIAMGALLAVPAFAFAHSDLSLIKSVDRAEAAPGDLLTYTLVIQQHGTHANAPGTVTDTLPPSTTYVSSSAGCTAVGALITCPIGAVAVGQVVTLTITVRVDDNVPAGTLLNFADVNTPDDTNPDNNHGSAITVVNFAGLGDFVWWDQNHNGLQDAGGDEQVRPRAAAEVQHDGARIRAPQHPVVCDTGEARHRHVGHQR